MVKIKKGFQRIGTHYIQDRDIHKYRKMEEKEREREREREREKKKKKKKERERRICGG